MFSDILTLPSLAKCLMINVPNDIACIYFFPSLIIQDFLFDLLSEKIFETTYPFQDFFFLN